MLDRRTFLSAAAASAALPPAIARARSIDAHVKAGTIQDVEHVVVFMQENRSFDHYFGAMPGVRGFGDRFPIPLPGGRTVWTQANREGPGRPPRIAPFPLNTTQTFAHMRVEGTPHNWTDAQDAWDEGRIRRWPAVKGEHAMGHYGAADLPFQFALANAFTLCDAYYSSMQCGTNSNRLFLFTGTNDPTGAGGGPAISNSHDSFPEAGGAVEGYRWTTYPERLSAAGISWRIYQDMADLFSDNPLVGFQQYRDARAGAAGADPRLLREGLTTRRLDALKADVLADRLPQVSWIIAGAAESEHPGPSSPAQGADFTARLLDALTANPDVWAKTVLLLMFDENDGFFDHLPPPAPPSMDAGGRPLGASTAPTAGEYHRVRAASEAPVDRADLMGRPYGLGPRAPMYVISPWSRGGWVNSQVFDHTSVIRFLEARFGVMEPNISPWRRAVCGDLTSAFDFKTPNRTAQARLPATAETAARAAKLPHARPPTPAEPAPPVQATGVRPSRPLPYALDVTLRGVDGGARLSFANSGRAGAVFHLYDLKDLGAVPRRYTVEAGKRLDAAWGGDYDLWILGPNGFHRRFRGRGAGPAVTAAYDRAKAALTLAFHNPTGRPMDIGVAPNAYVKACLPERVALTPGATARRSWSLAKSGGWYDLAVTVAGDADFLQRYAGRVETGRASVSDPEMGGPALMSWA